MSADAARFQGRRKLIAAAIGEASIVELCCRLKKKEEEAKEEEERVGKMQHVSLVDFIWELGLWGKVRIMKYLYKITIF